MHGAAIRGCIAACRRAALSRARAGSRFEQKPKRPASLSSTGRCSYGGGKLAGNYCVRANANGELPVRPASRNLRRRAGARVGLPLPCLPETQREPILGSGALARCPGERGGKQQDLDAHCRQRPPSDLSLLPRVWIDRQLYHRRLAGRDRGAAGRVRGSGFSGTALFGLRTPQARVGGDHGRRDRALLDPQRGAPARTPLTGAGTGSLVQAASQLVGDRFV